MDTSPVKRKGNLDLGDRSYLRVRIPFSLKQDEEFGINGNLKLTEGRSWGGGRKTNAHPYWSMQNLR
jgi:hypothetical protein